MTMRLMVNWTRKASQIQRETNSAPTMVHWIRMAFVDTEGDKLDEKIAGAGGFSLILPESRERIL